MGLTDVFATVTVPKPEYEEMVRENERLNIIRRKIAQDKYVGLSDIKVILDIEDEKESEE